MINFNTIDWKLLRKQKITLIEQISSCKPSSSENLEGILNLLDYIQDSAAEELGDKIVFGKDYETV